MRFIKYLMIFSIILLPSTNACYYQSATRAVVKTDCTKSFSSSETIPGTPNITTKSSRCKDYRFKVRSLKMALDIFVEEYSSSFGVSKTAVWESLRDLKIEVSVIPRVVKAAYSVTGKLLKGDVPVSGLALSKDLIWVEVKTSQIWPTALIHELVHIMIWRYNIVHGDPDHEGPEFSGWTKEHTKLIDKVNKILLDAEI